MKRKSKNKTEENTVVEKKSEERGDSVGEIVGGRLCGFSDKIFWDLDENICIILRDLLRKFAEVDTCSYPTELEKSMGFNSSRRPTEEEYEILKKNWSQILYGIADRFDEYIICTNKTDEEVKAKIKETFAELARWFTYLWE